MHPLVMLSHSTEVTAVSRFARAAADMTRAEIYAWYQQEVASAPKRTTRGKTYFVGHDGSVNSGSETNRAEEHMAIALFNAYGKTTEGLVLPDGERLCLLDYQFPLKASQSDRGIGKVDLLGVFSSGRVGGIELKRTGEATPETPLRALLEGLAYAAVIQANLETIAAEAKTLFGIQLSQKTPAVIVMAPQLYWNYFERTKAAGEWREAMDRLKADIAAATDVPVYFLGLGECDVALGLDGNPPTLTGTVAAKWVL
jgi:hypothetical protein